MASILELAQLSNAAYGGKTVPSGWVRLKPSAPDTDGYYAVAYVNEATQEIVIANRGTRPTHLSDLEADADLATGHETNQQSEAIAFAKTIADQIQNDPRYRDYSLIETGHSLGGNEAQAAVAALKDSAAYHGVPVSGVTFNAPGIAAEKRGRIYFSVRDGESSIGLT